MEPVTDQHVYSGRYRVTHLIARGGMAQVYRAQDLMLNRPVALKVLYPELSVDPTFVERFRREAQAAANLSHPNIVPVFDWGEENGTYFIVMELVEGTSLAGLLREHRTMSAHRAAELVAQVAAALAQAHRSGVVHRDVKPGNILLTEEGQVKVTDFGIAQAVSTEDNLTAAGSVMGTATYFSPEQAEGAAVDGRSDVYSLGVVLYELLAGRPPFVGDAPVAVAGMHVRDVVPSPRQFNPGIPADVESVVMTALAKRPGQRYQTADELRADLLRFLEGRPVNASRGGAFVGNDATQAVSVIAGERTQAVPVQSGPRTDVVRRRKNNSTRNAVFAAVSVLLIGALGFFFLAGGGSSTMPDVVGQTISEATDTLTGQGLVIGSTKLVQSDQPAGTVVATEPKAGASISKGQSVSLRISLGNSSQPVTIPDTVNMGLSDAENTLQQAGLAYRVVFTSTSSSNARPNTVLYQDPPGGVEGRTGDTVTLTVLSPGSQFPVPDVTGQSALDAASLLGQSGLQVDNTQGSACSNVHAEGLVVATSPAIGSLVVSNDKIQLILSTGYCDVVVPDVTGMTKALATTTMQQQGLVVTMVTLVSMSTDCSNGTVRDQVMSQTLSPGSQHPYKTEVKLNWCP